MKKNVYPAVVVLTVLFSMTCQDDQKAGDSERTDAIVQDLLDKLEVLQPPDIEYDRFCAEADTIVIAKLVDKQATDWASVTLSERDLAVKGALPISNRMKVLGVLKGDCDASINVHTVQWPKKRMVLINYAFADLRRTKTKALSKSIPILRPGELELKADEINAKTNGSLETIVVEPVYLLFLKQIDGDYVPVTGLRYSAASVFQINRI